MITLHTLPRYALFLLFSLSFSILSAQLNVSPTASVTDGSNYPTVNGAFDITTVVIGTKTYALVTSPADDGVQIIDISDPANPSAVASVTDGTDYPALDDARGITTVVIGGNTYALVAATNDDGVQIIDISNPANPSAVASLTDGATYPELNDAWDITTVVIGTKTYALVASYIDDGVQIIDISDPASPSAVASVTDGTDYPVLNGPRKVTTVVIGTKTYALVTASNDGGVQIIDISDPASPSAVASVTDGADYPALDGAWGITTVVIGTKTYALVAATNDDGVQIIDISDPASPSAVGTVTDGETYPALNAPIAITTLVIGENTYALVTAFWDNGVQIIDISDPANPSAVASVIDGEDGFDVLEGVRQVTTVVIGTKTYALVAASVDDGVQIIDISDPANPSAEGTDADETDYHALDGAWGITTEVIGTKTYALVAATNDDGVQIIDISDPVSPSAVASVTEGTDYPELDGARGITTVVIGTKTYALVAAFDDDGVQIIDISDPANPSAVASVTNGTDYPALDGAWGITTVVIGTKTYALVAAFDDGIQIIDISDPASPSAVASVFDGTDYPVLNGSKNVATVVIGTKTYALVTASNDDGVQIIDISDPASPSAVASVTDGADYPALDGAWGITTVVIGTKTYALVAATNDDGVQIIDISDPASPSAVGTVTDGETYPALNAPIAITTLVIGENTYALVTAFWDNGVQIIDISDPANPSAVASVIDGEDGFDVLEGVRQVTTVVIGTKTYALVASGNGDGVQIMELANPSLNAEEILAQSVLLYPNPAKSQLQVEYTHPTQASYTIYSLTGQVMATAQHSHLAHSINVSHLNSGTYLLQAKTGHEEKYYHFIKE